LLILHYLPVYTFKTIIPGFFNLVHARNTGAGFSLFAGASASWRQPFLIGSSLLIIAIILYAYSRVRRDDHWSRTMYAMIVAGAVGNLIDRFRFGEVIDFLDVYIRSYHWPAFNVADSAISVGAVMLIVAMIRAK
jgi:signal peptidase II